MILSGIIIWSIMFKENVEILFKFLPAATKNKFKLVYLIFQDISKVFTYSICV